MKRYLAIGIIFILPLLLVPTAMSEGEKPDLVILDIYDFKSQDFSEDLKVKIANIGDAPVLPGNFYAIHVIVERLLLNKIPIRTVHDYVFDHGSNTEPLLPGEAVDIEVYWGRGFISGFFVIHITVNKYRTTEEENYYNNYRFEKFFGRGIIFWNWYPCY